MKNLGSLGGTCTVVSDLNNLGQVVGQSNLTGDELFHPFLWDGEKLKDLGTLGGSTGRATVINQAGDVAGWADLSGNQISHAFLWSNGRMKDLGGLDGFACNVPFSVNVARQVVGISHDCSFDQASAFLWEPGGPMIDLNAFVPPGSDLLLRNATNINDRGEIALVAERSNGDHRAVLLIPCDVRVDGASCRLAAPLSSQHNERTPEWLAAARRRMDLRYRGLNFRR